MSVINIETFRKSERSFPIDGSSALKPVSIPEEICFSTEGYVAPNAGVRARGIQRRGLARVDNEIAKYEQTGEFTQDTARATNNAFVRMAIVRGEGNIVNISGAIRLPEGVSPHFLLEDIGQKTLGTDARAARYGRMSLMVADFDQVDYEKLFLRMASATSEMHAQHFSPSEALVLNGLQEKRAKELIDRVGLVKGVIDGEILPNITAVSDESQGMEHFFWTGKRKGDQIMGINPDGVWQNQAELSKFAPDLVTKGLLGHELDLLLSAKEGKTRIIFIGDNEAYVKRCCVSASNDQQERVLTSSDLDLQMKETSLDIVDLSENLLFQANTLRSSGGGLTDRYDNENCPNCGKERFRDDGCKCSTQHLRES